MAVRRLAEHRTQLLGLIGYGFENPTKFASQTECPWLEVPMPVLGGRGPWVEAWLGEVAAQYGVTRMVRHACDGSTFFGALSIPTEPRDSLEVETYRGYREILRVLGAAGYPYLLRMWNYVPGINQDFRGLERYQRFCMGRYQAFEEHGLAFAEDLPAASAVGIEDDRLRICFLASRLPATHIENPRQLSAYRYPVQYGPRSPSFSRASLQPGGGGSRLYLSGTASIVGHKTRHPGDALAQLVETLRNIETILGRTPHAVRCLGDLTHEAMLKVYLREVKDYPPLADALAGHVPAACPILFLRGDLCRRDLLVEIEGVIPLPDRAARLATGAAEGEHSAKTDPLPIESN